MVREAQVIYRVPRRGRGWELSEETMPESVVHDEAVTLLHAILAYWARGRTEMQVARNLAIRWDEDEPRIGVDPDVSVLSPRPPCAPGEDLTSVRTWRSGHAPPLVAAEVVSDNNPRKDYVTAPDKYASSGTEELWIFDPKLSGPTSQGGPFRLQVWRRDEADDFTRVYAGDGPVYAKAVGGWLLVTDDGMKLRIAERPDGEGLWPTEGEAERAAKEAERAAKEAERAAKEAALARLAAVEAELRALKQR